MTCEAHELGHVPSFELLDDDDAQILAARAGVRFAQRELARVL